MAVFVIGSDGTPLMPCCEKRARKLLESGKARLHRLFPFSIRFVERKELVDCRQDLTLKISPGSESTGFAIVRHDGEFTQVVFLAELEHRGWKIAKSLQLRRLRRHRRRSSNLRYRAPRFLNRSKPSGWVPPSILHRVETVVTWARRLSRLAPITSMAVELTSSDSREVRVQSAVRAVREKNPSKADFRSRVYSVWGKRCIYCGVRDVPLQLDHIVARSRGGSNRLSNRVPVCQPCNEKKGTRPIEEFLKDKPALLQTILRKMDAPMRDAAALYAMRCGLRRELINNLPPLKLVSADLREANIARLGIPASPAFNAACAGVTGKLTGWKLPILRIRSMGRGSYQRTGSYKHGSKKGDHNNRLFFRRKKDIHGFRTGDLVKALVTRGKNRGVHRGRAAVQASGVLEVKTNKGIKVQTGVKNCKLIQRGDGYAYSTIKQARESSTT